jgi:hypothetical protein
MGTLHEDLCTFMVICCLILLKINISGKSFRGSQNTHLICNKFFSENYAVYEIMWKSMVETDRPQMTAYYSAQTV